MRKKTGNTFKSAYFIFLCFMVFIAIAATIYVRVTLGKYKDSLPERVVEAQIDELRSDASTGLLWDKYPLPDTEVGKFEENIDIRSHYAELFNGDGVSYTLKAGSVTDSEQTYSVTNGECVIAEVTVQKHGEDKTKLFILNFSEWSLKSVKLTVEPHSYKIDVPNDFKVSVNGIELGSEDRLLSSGYEIKGLYFPPSISIKDVDGRQAEYRISGSNVKVVLFDYSLTLPRTLRVTLNGEIHTGDVLSDGMVRHDIRSLSRPDVKISDLFGNTVQYDGGNDLELTYISVNAPDNYSITVGGTSVPAEVIETVANSSIDIIREYDPSVPKQCNYCIAVLKKDAAVEIKDAAGKKVEYDRNQTVVDLTFASGSDTVPDDIASEVNVLDIAKKWSLFMTKDLEGSSYGFYNMSAYLIEGSPLYESAVKWVNGIDITFTSEHTLGNPPFSQETVGNFTRLSDNSFYVDVTLVKDMYVRGNLVPDTMSNRLYFVKYDGTRDGIDNPVWKLADMS